MANKHNSLNPSVILPEALRTGKDAPTRLKVRGGGSKPKLTCIDCGNNNKLSPLGYKGRGAQCWDCGLMRTVNEKGIISYVRVDPTCAETMQWTWHTVPKGCLGVFSGKEI